MDKSNLEMIEELIDTYHCYDARMIHLETKHLGDQLDLIYEDTKDKGVLYQFKNCYSIWFNHDVTYQKEVAYDTIERSQIPYFIQSVKVQSEWHNERDYLKFTIDAWPMTLEISCLNFSICEVPLVE